jgi:hypothetical protein
MKYKIVFTLISLFTFSCQSIKEENLPIQGTWKLFSAILIEKGDTSITDYSKKVSFIKIINESHFAFLNHDLNNGKDSTASYSSGGGKYEIKGNKYIEHLEYCTDRAWEGHDFEFVLEIKNDTLIQTGFEKVPEKGIDRLNIEKYVLLK